MDDIISQLHEATENLINQQFYQQGTDTIIGRTSEVHLKIRYSGQVISKFKKRFNDHLDLFLDNKYQEFIFLFEDIGGMTKNDLMEMHQDMELKLEALRGAELETVVLYTIVLSSIVTQIRDYNFQNTVAEIKKRIKEKAEGKISEDIIQDHLNNLYMRNHPNVSILYNIAYLDALAESFNYSKVARVCKIQKSKYINYIVDGVLQKNK